MRNRSRGLIFGCNARPVVFARVFEGRVLASCQQDKRAWFGIRSYLALLSSAALREPIYPECESAVVA